MGTLHLAGTSLATYNALYYAILWGVLGLVVMIVMGCVAWFLFGKARYLHTRTRQVQDLITTQADIITDLINDAERTDKRISYEELVGENLLRRLFSARELAAQYERHSLR